MGSLPGRSASFALALLCSFGPTDALWAPQIFSWHFWPSTANPLGHQWTLNPEPWPSNPHNAESPVQYLGYSIEEPCRKVSLDFDLSSALLTSVTPVERPPRLALAMATVVLEHPDQASSLRLRQAL